jgi:hypothetical protein
MRAIIIGVAALSATVQLPGILVDPGKANVALERPRPVRHVERRYEWEMSALRINTLAAAAQVPANVRYLTGSEAPPRGIGRRPDVPLSQQFAFSLDFWWMYAFYLGVLPRLAAVAVPIIGLAIAAWLFGRLRGLSTQVT